MTAAFIASSPRACGPQPGIALALGQRQLEVAPDLLVARDRAGDQEHVRPPAPRSRGQGLERPGEELGRPLRLADNDESLCEREQAGAPLR